MSAATAADAPNRAGASAFAVLRWLGGRLQQYWTILAVLAVWQLWITLGAVQAIVMPSPAAVVRDIVTNPAVYWEATRQTLAVAIVGLLIGTTVGTALALIAYLWRLAAAMIAPSLVIARALPIVVLVPVLTRVLGFSLSTVVFIASFIAFFPAFVLVSSGLQSVSQATKQVGDAFGAPRLRRLLLVEFPSALPAVFTALRLSSGACVLAAMVAEFLTGVGGLGHVFSLSMHLLSFDRSWGAALVGAVASVLLFRLAQRAEVRAHERLQ